MNYATLKDVLKKRQNGSFMNIVYERQLPTLKAHAGDIITKRTTSVVRAGIGYDNLSAVKEKRESGVLPAVNAGLTWGEWDDYPFTVKHKGEKYLRVYPSKNNRSDVRYFLNGREVSKDVVQPMCQKNAFRDGEMPDTLSINLKNIISVR